MTWYRNYSLWNHAYSAKITNCAVCAMLRFAGDFGQGQVVTSAEHKHVWPLS